MNEWIAVGISGTALFVSGVTAWVTLLRRGHLRMTQPTVIFFGPDGVGEEGAKARVKVFLRTLLYSTSRNGQMLESMHVSLQRGETTQNFSIWVYGEDKLVRGSGLFVGPDGVVHNHHFLLPEDGSAFSLVSGDYCLKLFGKRVTDKTTVELASIKLTITESQARQLKDDNAGLYFDWGPDQQTYHGHIDIKKFSRFPEWLSETASQQVGMMRSEDELQ